ncbi:GNAT family N-acetyltransferase [Tunicatimonas pelagia]|uniref:GNAT family N-acetyltransferase n=1 Tax=Tunicatimonas pelagia TaxID=931531 RepID=UPI0026658AE5|nr:GNAT family protein [Tunicatimonas pelagia]WKN41202.1 GNAT family protein [Tunicatimonas pelagia]
MQSELITDRLQLKIITSDDLDDIHYLHSLPETDRYNTLGIPEDRAVTEAIVQQWLNQQQAEPNHHFTWRISDRATQNFIGLIALHLGEERFQLATVWYKLLPVFWGKGLATEALNEVLRFGFKELHLHRIEAGCATKNIASARVLEKVGMQREGSKRKVLPIRGQWVDNHEYAILEEDWKRTKK